MLLPQSLTSHILNAAIKPMIQASPRVREDEKMKAENIDIETEAATALDWHHLIVQLLENLELTTSG
jgi:hypothetical protein